jgi:WG containing repeat
MKKIILCGFLLLAVLACYSQVFFKNNKNMWGLKDKAGKVLVEPKYYNRPGPFIEGRSVYSKLGLKGLLDESGKEVTPPVYYSINDFKYGYATVTKEFTDTTKKVNGKFTKYQLRGVIDRNGKEVVPVIYKEMLGDMSNGWFVKVWNDPKEKIHINTTGAMFTVPADLLLMTDRIDGKKFIAFKNSKYGIVDQQLKVLLPFEYDRITPADNGLLIVGQNNLFGLMDLKMKWVLKPAFTNIHKFQNGYAIITDSTGKYGAINTKGIVTTKPQFNIIARIDKTSSAIALYRYNSDRSGLVDLATGKIITAAEYMMFASSYDYGMIYFSKDGKKGMMDSTGKVIFYDTFNDFSPGFLENRAWVMKDNKYGFVDKTGTVVIPIQYDMVGGFSEGLAKIKANGKYGFINAKGDVVIPPTFIDAQNFESGMAWVKDANKAYYIDKTGKEIL